MSRYNLPVNLRALTTLTEPTLLYRPELYEQRGGPSQRASSILTINLHAIAANYTQLQHMAAPAQTAAVLKANAYGVGIDHVAPCLAAAGCTLFFVADLHEAIILRAILPNADIAILAGIPRGNEKDAIHYRVWPVLNSLQAIQQWRSAALQAEQALPCMVHIDTGMSRLGLSQAAVHHIINQPYSLHGLDIRFWLSHFIDSDNPDPIPSRTQYETFKTYLQHLPPAPASISNGAGLFQDRRFNMDMIRPGDTLYGRNPTLGKPNPFQQVFDWQARILQIDTAAKDQTIGYGATYTAPHDIKFAVLGVGYADGLLRSGSNHLTVYIGGHPAPVIGRISMDLTTVDVTQIPESVLQDYGWAELMGPHQSLDQLAEGCQTIPHEILTKLPFRVHRIYQPAEPPLS